MTLFVILYRYSNSGHKINGCDIRPVAQYASTNNQGKKESIHIKLQSPERLTGLILQISKTLRGTQCIGWMPLEWIIERLLSHCVAIACESQSEQSQELHQAFDSS
jgi:hypothetical protein